MTHVVSLKRNKKNQCLQILKKGTIIWFAISSIEKNMKIGHILKIKHRRWKEN